MYRIKFVLAGVLVILLQVQAHAANSIQSPDTVGDVGLANSLVLDGSGYPVVSYVSAISGDLKILHCNDVNCAGSDESIQAPDFNGRRVEFATAMVLDSSGYPVVVYTDVRSGGSSLNVLHCNDVNCVGGDDSIQHLVLDKVNGRNGLSLALDARGYPVVSYHDEDVRGLAVLHCNDANCVGGDESINIVDAPEWTGLFSSLVLDNEGNPVVSYYEIIVSAAVFNLKVLHCNDAKCFGGDESIVVVDDHFAGRFSSLGLDVNGYPVVAYSGGDENDLRILHCNDANCVGGDDKIVSPDTAGLVGYGPSLVLDSSGYPVVSYIERTDGKLKVMHCNDVDCFGYDESIVSVDTYTRDPTSDYGYFTSIALDSSGYPVVSYMDSAPNYDLKVLHCADAVCTTTNTAPVVDAGGPYTGLPNVGIELSGSLSSDPEGDALTYSWAVDAPASCNLDDTSLENPVLICTSAGNYIVTLTVDDGDLNDSVMAAVSVATQAEAISDIQSVLDALVADETLKRGPANGLSQPLRNVLRSLAKVNTAAACSQLQDFIDEVNKKTPEPLVVPLAAELIDKAEAIRTSLGCRP